MLWEKALLEEETVLKVPRKSVEVKSLDRQTSSAFGSTAGQNFAAVFCAHAFPESVLALLFKV